MRYYIIASYAIMLIPCALWYNADKDKYQPGLGPACLFMFSPIVVFASVFVIVLSLPLIVTACCIKWFTKRNPNA